MLITIMVTLMLMACLLMTQWPFPDPIVAERVKKTMVPAVLLMTAGVVYGQFSQQPDDRLQECRTAVPPIPVHESIIRRNELAVSLRPVWQSRDPDKYQRFQRELKAAVGDDIIRAKVAQMLMLAYRGLADYQWRLEQAGYQIPTTCNDHQIPIILMDTDTCQMVHWHNPSPGKSKQRRRHSGYSRYDMAREMMARRLQKKYDAMILRPQSDDMDRPLAGCTCPQDSAWIAADMIQLMECKPTGRSSVSRRLNQMKRDVSLLLSHGPLVNDWGNTKIEPNIYRILQEQGLIQTCPGCYWQSLQEPAFQRSNELRLLQRELSRRDSGIIDVDEEVHQETVLRDFGLFMTTKEDYAVEKEIADYQRTVQRTIRMLYKRGEITSSLVERIERVIDLEIIEFDPSMTLQKDVEFYLRGILDQEYLEILEKRRIIASAENHRFLYQSYRGDPTRKKIEKELKSLLYSDETIYFQMDQTCQMDHALPLQADSHDSLRLGCRAYLKAIEIVMGPDFMISEYDRLGPVQLLLKDPIFAEYQ